MAEPESREPLPADYREALHLAVQLYADQADFDGETVLHAADIFCARLSRCPPALPGMGQQIITALATILANQEKIMSSQSDIDAATAALTAITGDVATNVAQLVNVDVPAIQAALAALPASVDTTALNAAVTAAQETASSLDTSVAGVTALTSPPAPPAPSA